MLTKIVNKTKSIEHMLCEKISTMKAKLKLSAYGIPYGDGLKVRGNIVFQCNGSIEIGRNVRINSSFWANPIAASSHTSICVRGGGYSL